MLTELWRVICESLRASVRGVGLLGLGLCALPALAASPAAGQTRESAAVNGSPSKLADAIRPFRINIPESKLVDLRERVIATRWPDKETVTDQSVLMQRLGYKRYVSQGGDWGSVIADAMARQAPPGLVGIHVNMPATVPDDVVKALNDGGPLPAGMSVEETAAYESLSSFFSKNAGFGVMMVTRPQTVGYGLLYWLTNTVISSARLYWENNNNNFGATAQKTREITIPVGVTVFPGEIYRAPRTWTEQAYGNLASQSSELERSL